MRIGINRTMLSLAAVIGGLLTATPAATAEPPPDVASYEIEAAYEPADHLIIAREAATYTNLTDTAIPNLVLHLYLNAFSNPDTLWMREAGPVHRGYAYSPAYPGWIRIDEILLEDGAVLEWAPIDGDATLVRVDLPQPVQPGDSVRVEITFEAQLPRVFARTGWADAPGAGAPAEGGGDFVMAGQWFPKFGVWEEGGWNAYAFRANSEFYADFGSYDVALTLPEGWRVGATGVPAGELIANADGTVTHTFHADHVIDFAWSASPRFKTLAEQAGGVEVTVFYLPGQRSEANRVMAAALQGLELYQEWYGAYGRGLYDALTVIVVPPSAGGAGGMEYPMLFTVGATVPAGMPRCVRMLEVETVHELGHQWFQSMVATNEAEEPWLDEGFTDYSTARAMRELDGGDAIACGGWTLSYLGMQRISYVAMPDTPMAGHAWEFGMEYAIATYSKPVVALSTLERYVGELAMLEFLGTYVDRYAFRHPSADDVRAVMSETLGAETTAWFFDEVVNSGATLDAQVFATAASGDAAVRRGDLCLPVTVKVTTASGSEIVDWPCDGALKVAAEDWVGVEVDPERVMLLDLNLANNATQEGTDWGPRFSARWVGALVRVTQALQSLFAGAWRR